MNIYRFEKEVIMDVPCNTKWVKSIKNSGTLLEDPHKFQYYLASKHKEKSYYQCKEKNLGCKATCVVDTNVGMIIKFRNEHSHDTDLVKKRVQEIVAECVENAVNNPTIPPRVVIQTIVQQVLTDNITKGSGVGCVPIAKTIARMIQKKRQQTLQCPPLPFKWEKVEIPESLQLDSSGKPWVRMCKQLNPEDHQSPKIVGLCSDQGLDLLKTAKSWSVDGTFEVMKTTMFSQLWIFYTLSGE